MYIYSVKEAMIWWFGILILVVQATAQHLPPKFIPGSDMRGFALSEDTAVGSSIYTLRGTDPENSKVTYSVSGDYLSVNRNSGVVTLIQPLDRETIDSIETIITVTDEERFGKDPYTIPLRIKIPILDVNDNRPIFHSLPYHFKVSESASPGATLFSDIVVTDKDTGRNSDITLSCLAEETPIACSLFQVREVKVSDGHFMGVISLAAHLDYEVESRYNLKIKAEDGGGLWSTATITVAITDVQDQPPALLNAPYSASITEGSKSGLRILEIEGRDGDKGEPHPLRLTLDGDSKGYFALTDTQTGSDGIARATLVTSDIPLDREDEIIAKNGGIYSFYIKAEELSAARAVTRSRVVIVVTDRDDQKATFNKEEIEVTVSENIANGTPLPGLDVIVSDGDIGNNSKFKLYLEDALNTKGSEAIFEVFPKEGFGSTPVIVKVVDGSFLDYEDPSGMQFAFKVVAKQRNEEVSSCLVRVNVKDANDNAPIFTSASYRFSIKENAPSHTSVAVLTATDEDSEEFGSLSYSLKGFGSEKFFVNSSSGLISVANCRSSPCLDFEIQPRYSLTYTAIDGGGKISSVNVFIDVVDVNDNPPSFESVEYRRVVDEGATRFDPPLFVMATDADGEDQGGGVVAYSLHDGNTEDKAFVVDSNTGEITIRRPLTHLDTASSIYALTIRATDAGVPPLFSDVRVLVTVGRDKNRPPRFTKPVYYAQIPENSKPGTRLVSVKARDPDGYDSAITYQWGSRGGADHFDLDPKTGNILVSQSASLDRDVENNFQLVVRAIDGGRETQQSTTALVNVTLLDINNKAPVFEKKSYVGHVNERSAKGDVVLRVLATDRDSDARLSYALTRPIFAYDKTGVKIPSDSSYDFAKAFSVNKQTGEIFVTGKLDHDAAAVLVFSVAVTDENADEKFPGQKDTAEITVYVQVFSDKNPIFDFPWTPARPVLSFDIPEEQPVGEVIFSVAAKDPVTGRAVRRYEKVKNSDRDDLFSVDPISGQVSLMKRLDYEASNNKELSCEVIAIAGDRSSKAKLIINLLDINDHNPKFIDKEYHARLKEDALWPQTVLEVLATDEDSGEHGHVQYELGGEDKHLFIINVTTGLIQVAPGAILDREKAPVVNLEVIAFDSPNARASSKSSVTKVSIELLDVNDEAPSWPNGGVYRAVVPENSPTGTVVTKVKAVDPDLGVNGVVTYRIPELQGLGGYFKIDPESGVLRVHSPLNGKGRTIPYHLTVRAIDGGTPSQFSEAQVTLFIGDVSFNDGIPVFIRPAPNETAHIIENSPIGTVVFQAKAIDADSSDSPDGRIMYSFLQNPGGESPFNIDANSGLITTRGKLDRETKSLYRLVVVAQDMGKVPQVTSTVLLVHITDADDNDPKFARLEGKEWLKMEVEEEAAVGTPVGRVRAIDPDIGPNALINYEIIKGNENQYFGIRRTKNNEGEIYVKGRIDREAVSEIELVIWCGKPGEIPQESFSDSNKDKIIKVKVEVSDLDDNRPQFNETDLSAGVRIDAPLLTNVLKFEATDADPTSPAISYSIYNASVSRLGRGGELATLVPINGTDIFLLEKGLGILMTSAPLGGYGGDIFTLFIAATSDLNRKPALTKVTIFILHDSEMLRFVFEKSPREVKTQMSDFTEEVQKSLPVSNALKIYHTGYYDDANGHIDYESSGSCFQLIGRSIEETQKILNEKKNGKLNSVYKRFGVKSVESCRPRSAGTKVDWVEIWVLVIAAFIGLGAFISSCAICCLYSCYKRRINKNLHHMRLLDNPKLIYGAPPMHPGSIVMLPPPPPSIRSPHDPPIDASGLEWQEMAGPVDNISYGSVPR